MKNILTSIEDSLYHKNWYSALILSLTLPDICSKLEGGNSYSSKRYPEWFNKYLGEEYRELLSGQDCYSLRCAYLHEGSPSIESQQARDILDRFVFVSSGPHCIRFKDCYFGDKKYDLKNILQISVYSFCKDMCRATNQWLLDVKDNPLIQRNIEEMLTIHEDGISICGVRIE